MGTWGKRKAQSDGESEEGSKRSRSENRRKTGIRLTNKLEKPEQRDTLRGRIYQRKESCDGKEKGERLGPGKVIGKSKGAAKENGKGAELLPIARL